MNYKRIYEQLIDRGKTRIIDGYSEKHHIVPRCLGGSDDSSNLVALTPEEHFVAHVLLVKMYPKSSTERSLLIVAVQGMCQGHSGKRFRRMY